MMLSPQQCESLIAVLNGTIDKNKPDSQVVRDLRPIRDRLMLHMDQWIEHVVELQHKADA